MIIVLHANNKCVAYSVKNANSCALLGRMKSHSSILINMGVVTWEYRNTGHIAMGVVSVFITSA